MGSFNSLGKLDYESAHQNTLFKQQPTNQIQLNEYREETLAIYSMGALMLQEPRLLFALNLAVLF